MRKAYVILLLVCLSVRAITLGWNRLQVQAASRVPLVPHDANPETRLAFGAKMSLSQIDEVDLEMIPHLGKVLSEKIDSRKPAILERARTMPSEQTHKAFEIVKGIGAKRAAALSSFIELR